MLTSPSRRTVQFDPLTYSMNDPDRRLLRLPSSRAQRRARDLEGFTVEHIPDGYDIDESSHRRNAQMIEKAMAGKAVSRAPLLSAIEEGGTITSLTQILTSDEEDDAADPGRMELIPEIHEDPQTDTTTEADSTVPAQRLSFLIPTITVDDYS